jgi:Na+-transporting NADH:ubiquinone oxidoreductase subunit F
MANHPAEQHYSQHPTYYSPFDRKNGGFMKVNPGILFLFFSLKPGDKVNIAGPFGDFHIKPTQRNDLYRRRSRMAPLRSHLFHLFIP